MSNDFRRPSPPIESSLDSPVRDVRFANVLHTLRRGAPFAVFVAVIAAVIAVLMTSRMDPVYTATASVLASRPSASFGNLDLIVPPTVDPRVYQRLLLDGAVIREAIHRVDGSTPTEAELEAFMRRISVSVESQEISSIIRVEVRNSSPDIAAEYANAIATALIDWDRNRAREMVDNSIRAAERAVAELDESIARAVGSGQQDANMQALAATLREQRVRELEAARVRSTSAITVGLLESLTIAEPPARASGPRLVFNTFVALVIGLVFGYGLQFARWSLDDRIRDRGQLARLTRRPILAVYPQPGKGSRQVDADATSFLRANVLRSTRGTRPAVVGITSAGESAVKASVAIALSESLARSGYRTLLVDADLRHQGSSYGIDFNQTQSAPLEAHLQNSQLIIEPLQISIGPQHTVDVLPNRANVRQPSELLEFGFSSLLDRLRSHYDVILVDLPSVLDYPDALSVGTNCTGVVVCVSAEASGQRAIESVELLEASEINVLGLVLTSLNRAGTRSRNKPTSAPRDRDGEKPSPHVTRQGAEPSRQRSVARVKQR